MPKQTLWTFALRVYAAPCVAPACLELQDAHGVDVTLLMFAAWAGAEHGVLLDDSGFDTAQAAVADWRAAVVQPLRAVRRQLKDEAMAAFHDASPALREKVKALELEAERMQLDVLERSLVLRNLGAPGVDIAIANADAFLSRHAPQGDGGVLRLRDALQAGLTAP